jgi:hypothetical protein
MSEISNGRASGGTAISLGGLTGAAGAGTAPDPAVGAR